MQTTTVVNLPLGDVTVLASAGTSIGSVRSVNEDSFLAASPLFVVADGMGGHARGDRASQTVIAELSRLLPVGTLPTAAAVLTAITGSNDAVRALTDDDGQALLSGTTLTGISLVSTNNGASTHWMAFNVGDSRIYSWDGRRLAQLTVDHSVVQELVDSGAITEAQARLHPERNVITRAVGADVDVDADVWLLPVGGSQTFVLCSDGLTKELDDDEIAGVLARHGSDGGVDTVAEALVAAADRAGGKDNITVVVIASSFDGTGLRDDSTNERSMTAAAHLEDTRPRA